MLLDPEALDSLDGAAVAEVLESWVGFCDRTNVLLRGRGDLSAGADLVPLVASLCRFGLASLLQDHFLLSLEKAFKSDAALKFWKQFDAYYDLSKLGATDFHENWIEELLTKSLEEIFLEKNFQGKCLLMLVHALQSYEESTTDGMMKIPDYKSILISKYQLTVSSILLTTLPMHFPDSTCIYFGSLVAEVAIAYEHKFLLMDIIDYRSGSSYLSVVLEYEKAQWYLHDLILRMYFKGKLEELSNMMAVDHEEDASEFQLNNNGLSEESQRSSGVGEMDIDTYYYHGSSIAKNDTLVNNIGKVVRDLRSIGFTSMTEDAYASSILLLLKDKVHDLAGDDYRNPVLGSIKEWIQVVPLRFLHAFLLYLGDSPAQDSESSGLKSPLASSSSFPGIEMPSEGLVRWQLRLEYFAYETLQDLRIGKLFEIIVDYPESSPAIEDLKQCLEYTGQHSKLVDSFISSLRYRLLTAGASTNDILHQYVSTIKALRMIDPTGVFLEAVGEPIRDYLRGRKDTIKCIVTMLTDGTGGNSTGSGNSDSLLEELNRDVENQEGADNDDDANLDEKQAWINSQKWEPDPVEADPLKGSRTRRKVDILGMMVGIIGSKDQLVNEYRVMLAEKLLNKSDYDIDLEIRTLELLKIHFGEGSMQKCEIMLNDLIDSKRTNTNIKASLPPPANGLEQEETCLSLGVLDSTIISSNFWPTIQAESLNVPSSIEQLMSEYAKSYHEIKSPRKLLWKKNLGTVKLELEFEDRSMQFTVSPLHAVIIMQFQEQTSWTSKNLAAAVGIPTDALNKRMNFWISKAVLAESVGSDSGDHIFTIVNDMADPSRTGGSNERCEGILAMDDECERSLASVEDQLRKEMTVYEKFIIGMLTNFGNMTLDRIHNTLKMFCVAEPSYDKSLQQLQSFLSGLISEEKLEMREGLYFLKK